ncbi:MAG: ribonuclease HII [Nanoarchaeota archaeon]
MAILAGIDEAGRGPVIGPMVIAICLIDEKDEFQLKSMGVKDSKLLTPREREKLFLLIKSMSRNRIMILPPKKIDEAVNAKKFNLNWLEATVSARLINVTKPDKVILDCPSNNIKAYTAYLSKLINPKLKDKIKIIAEHKADLHYPIVSAASILAKVTRDKEIQKLKDTYKIDFGSGYPSDPITADFVRKYWNVYPFFRKSWETWKAAAEAQEQKKLGEY